MGRIIDLSLPIEANPFDNTFLKIQKIEHSRGGGIVWKNVFFPKKAPWFKKIKNVWKYLRHRSNYNRNSFPGGMFLSNEFYTLSVHCGTHLDAPYHYGPYCEGSASLTIDQIPLEWCYSTGVVLDMSHKKSGEVITEIDVKNALERISYTIKPFDIVLIRTDSDKLWPSCDYFSSHPGMSKAATVWLVKQGVKIIGIDTNGFDLPFMQMIKKFNTSGNQEDLWPNHMYGREHEYLQIERLANLDRLPVYFGFHVFCFPIALRGAGAGWIRAVAYVDS
ncbi:cyclase family protein [Paenibacillus sp. NPDC055715]